VPNFIAFLLAVLCASFPLANLNSVKAPSALFYAVLVFALVLLAQRRFAGFGEITTRYRPLLICFAVPLLAACVSSVYYSHWAGANGEGAIRFLLGLLLLLPAFALVPTQWLRQSAWGFALAGVVSSIIVLQLSWPHFIRPHTPVHNAVTYGNLMLLAAVVTCFSLGWRLTPWARIEAAAKIAVTVATLGGFMLTQTRSGWVAMPVFIVIGVVLFVGLKNRWRALAALVAVGAIMAGVFLSNDQLRSRAVMAYDETQSCLYEDKTQLTSVCVRLQLWRAAIDMAAQKPWVGIGDGGDFADHLKADSYPKGIVSEFVITEYFGEPHNDVLFLLATFGIPGAIGLLLIYLAPCWYFVRRLASHHPQHARAAAAMGLAFCLGFAVFGITELMFRRMHTIGFYSLFVALFLTLSDPGGTPAGKTTKT